MCPSSSNSGLSMKRSAKFCIMISLLGACAVCAGDTRVKLIPELHAGQTITYLIRYRSDKNVMTESNVVAPMAPNAAQMDAHGLLQVDVLDVQQVGGKAEIHARSQFRTLDSGVWVKKPGDKEPHWQVQKVDPEGKQIEFTILPDGSVEKITGLDSLFPEQQQAWQEWVARFAMALTLPQNGLKLREKWKSYQPENVGAPIAGLYLARES